MNGVIWTVVLTLSSEVVSQPAARPDAVLTWNEATLQAIKAERTPPPQAARHLAIVHAAVFDAVNAVTRTHRPYRVTAAPPPGTSAEAAAAVAAHRVLLSLYPNQIGVFDRTLDATLADVPHGPGKDAGVSLGLAVAEKLLSARAADGAGRRVAYYCNRRPGAWRPTPPGYRAALLPQWPRVTPFAVKDVGGFRPDDPPALDSRAYTEALHEVRALGAAHNSTRTPEQTRIAYFWADGDGTVTPPGHWNRIAQTVARSRGLTPTENARLFALLNLALADAAIVCWDCKYKFAFWRPVQAIREDAADPEPGWTPLLETPPFPSYTSGHSTFSGAAAAVLAEFFGTDDVPFTTDSDGLPGVRRSFARFSDAAAEAGMSRIYGGIHYSFDNAAGLKTGRQVGEAVAHHALRPLGSGVRESFRRDVSPRMPYLDP